jgi:hypothetical protein
MRLRDVSKMVLGPKYDWLIYLTSHRTARDGLAQKWAITDKGIFPCSIKVQSPVQYQKCL